MEITEQTIEDCIILDLNGVLDIYSHKSLYDTINKIKSCGYKKIIINMKDVDYIDSTGIGALVAVYKSSKSESIGLLYINIQEKVKDRIRLSKLYSFLPVAESLNEALDELR